MSGLEFKVVEMFRNWCRTTGHKNNFNNYIWWKDNARTDSRK